ncbi:MAG: DOMON-like domain-containing protein [Kiloniellales bacterium]|nr:DOMON-like domain-containing protein [Kiloniellales bacterium]
MHQELKLHPNSPCGAAIEIAVEAARPSPDALRLRYRVTGEIGAISLPAVAAAARADGLWQHTCFEAFLRAAPGGVYHEFNFAPSTLWAAYRFAGYRAGMRVAQEVEAPQLAVEARDGAFELRAELTLDRLPELPPDAPWQLGLSAVIEEVDGRLSYWALAHPPGRPDFHHSDCFALELAAALRA